MRIHRSLACYLCMAVAFSFLFVLPPSSARAQMRVNDKDVESMMRNLRDDAKAFRPEFDSAIKKSTIRKTSQAKDDRRLANEFEKQTEAMLNRFKKNRGNAPELQQVESSAEQLDTVVNNLQLGPRVTERWQKIRTELNQVKAAYNLP